MPRRSRFTAPAGVAFASIVACALLTDVGRGPTSAPAAASVDRKVAATGPAPETIRLAFAGDVHFEGEFADVPDSSSSTLGPMSDVLAAADLAMVNLESAITTSTEPTDKELEDPANRYWFATGAGALDVLDRSGVDVVSVANNHGADFGIAGVRDTIRAAEAGTHDVAVVGVGRNDREAFAPHRVQVKGTDVAVLAADASPGESDDAVWAAAPGSGPGIASARGAGLGALEAAVRESAATDDLVVVYLHWGEEGSASSTGSQERTAAALGAAGADIVVGTHAHTPLGAGLQGPTYVSYGLGNFYWYHGNESESGVLQLSVQGDEVIGDEWVPAEIPEEGGAPQPLTGDDASEAVADWNDLRKRTDLTAGPGPIEAPSTPGPDDGETLPAFAATTTAIGESVRRGMGGSGDDAICPVPLADLRHVTVTHVGLDGQAHRGELVVNADVADDVVGVFEALYAERFPIQRMLLIDEYDGDDDRSMAANNTSAYNCRRVAGSDSWSDHAYGRAIDINPVQNPYVVGGVARPPAAAPFVGVDRTADAAAEPGVIRENDVVRREFARIGWEWGGFFTEPDFQHFSAPATP